LKAGLGGFAGRQRENRGARSIFPIKLSLETWSTKRGGRPKKKGLLETRQILGKGGSIGGLEEGAVLKESVERVREFRGRISKACNHCGKKQHPHKLNANRRPKYL